jgi:hypothetical protein
VTQYEYDEETSERLHMDVVHEIDDSPMTPARWIESQRRLNAITDPLARKIIELHRECGSGNGECDSGDELDPAGRQPYWACETVALVASHFNVEFPPGESDV